MNTLNLGSDEIPATKKKSNTRNLKIALGLAAVILVPTIGSTLAGTITIGASNTLEFAQGVTATTACDEAIVITPVSTLTDAFKLSSLELTDIMNSGANTCAGKAFILKVISSVPELVAITNGADGAATQVKFTLPSSCVTGAIVDTPNTNATVETITCNATTGSITVTLATVVPATSVSKITLESSTPVA